MKTNKRKLVVFNNISLDAYFTDVNDDMSWAHQNDDEWNEFVSGNAKGESELIFGRITYDMMERFWPTAQAKEMMPTVAEGMNKAPKVVFSTTMDKATWNNTRLIKSDIVESIKKMKEEPSNGMVILGSGTIVSQLAAAGLIDEYQLVITPVVLGSGRTLFEGLKDHLNFKLISTRQFKNGNILVCYEPASSILN